MSILHKRDERKVDVAICRFYQLIQITINILLDFVIYYFFLSSLYLFLSDFNGLLFVFRIKNISCLNAARLVALLTLTEVPKNVSRLSKSLSRPAVISPKFGGC